MTLLTWIPLAVVCLLGAMSPGPSLAVILWNTLKRGSGAGYVAALSHAAGMTLYGLLTVAGLAALVTGLPAVFISLQLAGSAYLLYMGVQSLRSARSTFLSGQEAPAARFQHGSAAADGFLIAVLNPKIALFMLALFSQFIDPAAGWGQRWIMVATIGVLDAVWFCAVVTLVSHEKVLARLQRGGTIIDRTFGVILVLLALSVLLSIVLGHGA